MRKYRIVSRPSFLNPETPCYYAQYKFLNLIWLDCGPDWRTPGDSNSVNLKLVESFIESKIHNRTRDLSQRIIRTYD